MSITLEQLWQEVQRAHAKSTGNRAADNPEYAKAIAAWERVALAAYQPGNVLPLKRPGAK